MTLQNKNIAITGKLRNMTRSNAYALIINNGGIPKNNISNKVDILVISDDVYYDTTKIRKKADRALCINENEFYNLINANQCL